jgi:uracil-DNA glycosylase
MERTTDILRARIEWLRLMGVEAIRRPGASAPAARAPKAPAPKAPGTGDEAPRAAGPAVSAAPAPPPPSPKRPSAMRAVPLSLQGGLFGEAPPLDASAGARAGAAAGAPAPAAERGGAGDSPLAPFLATPAPAPSDPATSLAAVRAEIGDCRRCRLSERRTNIVFGVGNPAARLVFVGEGPGADEDAQGEPFVGRAGQLLTKIIEAMGLSRADVYIANVVKCRPPENRTPLPDEVATCSPFLFRQIGAIRPEVVVCLGTPAAQTLFGTRETITKIRGVFRVVEGVRVMPTFHPAYLLRNPAAKREVWEDMKQVMALLKPPA